MSLPPPSSSRRNSSLGVSPNNTGGRDTTVTHSQVTSEPTVPAPGHVNEPVADLVEKEVKETQGKDTVEPIVEDTEAENGQSDQVLEDTPVRGDKTSSPAPVENHTGNDATSSSSISPVKVTDKAEHESKEEVEDISAEPIEAKEPAAQKTPSKSRLSSQPSPLKVAETPTPLKKGTKLVPKVAGTPNKHKQSISAAAKVAKDSTPASSKTKPSQPSSPTTTTSLRKSVRSAKTDPAPLTPTKSESSKPSKAGATLHQSATTPVNNATSSASITILPRSTKKALARPSTSQGALSTPKAKTATSDAIPPMPAESKSPEDSLTPLRPQLTGHTASSLAKTRTPVAQKTMRAQTSMSLGRASGSRARPRPSSPTPAGGERSGHGKMSSSSSTSRLMQGTAASRARAADSPSLKAKTWSRSGTVKDLKKASETGTLGRAKTSQQKDESTGTAIVHSKTTVTGRPETSRLTSNEEKTNLATRGNGQDGSQEPAIATSISKEPESKHYDHDAPADETTRSAKVSPASGPSTEDSREASGGAERGGEQLDDQAQGKEVGKMEQAGEADVEAI
ncbi:hypothetical protein BD324DRAFT_636396, partial [Kockovaella imperatae]